MIDWLSFKIPALHEPIDAGRIVSLKAGGAIEYDIPKRQTVRGSYDSSVQVRSVGVLDESGHATHFEISGNPSKFLQGHNVHGSMDLLSLTASFVSEIETVLETNLQGALENARAGRFQVSRIDIAKNYRFEDNRTVNAALASLLTVARGRNGRAVGSGSTVYVGKKSRRWTMKFYNKGEEIKKHPLPEQLAGQGIEEYANGLLRVELTLRGLELGDLKNGAALSEVIDDKHGEYMERVGVPLQVDVQSDLVTAMPRAVRCTYLQWENGTDVRPSMSKTTFYKHRNDLLAYGVDIAVPKAAAGSVIPLFKTVSGEEVKTPSDWYARNLIHIGNLRYAS